MERGGLGILLAVTTLVRPATFWHGYLVAFNFWLGIALGSLVIIWLHQLTGGGWGWIVRPVQAAAATTVPLLGLAFIPLLFGLQELYPWARSEFFNEFKDARAKSLYLNETFFIARSIGYFVIWIGLATLTTGWLRAVDGASDSRAARRLAKISGPAIAAYALTITFAGIDWIMSLEPEWYSTIFSVIFSVGQILAALAFSVIGNDLGLVLDACEPGAGERRPA